MTEQRRERGQESAQENAGVVAEYADEYMPLAGYAGLMGAYIAIFGGLLVAGSGRRLPERISTPDLILRNFPRPGAAASGRRPADLPLVHRAVDRLEPRRRAGGRTSHHSADCWHLRHSHDIRLPAPRLRRRQEAGWIAVRS